jgi:hypothetical protein
LIPDALPLSPENRNRLSFGPRISRSVDVNTEPSPIRLISSSSSLFTLSLMLFWNSRPHSTRWCSCVAWRMNAVPIERDLAAPRPPHNAIWRESLSQRHSLQSGSSISAGCIGIAECHVDAGRQGIVGIGAEQRLVAVALRVPLREQLEARSTRRREQSIRSLSARCRCRPRSCRVKSRPRCPVHPGQWHRSPAPARVRCPRKPLDQRLQSLQPSNARFSPPAFHRLHICAMAHRPLGGRISLSAISSVNFGGARHYALFFISGGTYRPALTIASFSLAEPSIASF